MFALSNVFYNFDAVRFIVVSYNMVVLGHIFNIIEYDLLMDITCII